ncbi:MAG TPA: energy transducer TonB [Candidatus Acidoferrum sp.]|nr:energy transducer TonB [Candidatus Acidoferrum sp.]
MHRNRLLVAIVLLGFGAFWFERASASSHREDTLQSFYVARFYFSDYLPGWSDQILDVAPQGKDVRVIRISQLNDFCPGLIVRATERVFPHTSVRKIAGRDLCAFTSESVDAALKAAAPKYGGDPSDSATETIVAKCGAREREFDFPYPVEVDEEALRQSNPEVSDLWDTNYHVFEKAFGKSFSFNSLTPEQEKSMEDLGTKLLPDLKSGKYQTAYAGSKCGDQDCNNYLAWQLRDYGGLPQPYDPAVVTLLDASSLHLTKYVAPRISRVAQVANVYGDVRLRVIADPQTGAVKSVETISGHPILALSAVEAVKAWQFDPAGLSGKPAEVTLRFELKCR